MGFMSGIAAALHKHQCLNHTMTMVKKGEHTTIKHECGQTNIWLGSGNDKAHLHYNADGSGTLTVNGEKSELSKDEMKNVVLDAGRGNDQVVITGNPGLDNHLTIAGGKGDDILQGGSGNEVIYGSKGQDVIYGGGGNDTIDGGKGADYIDGGGGDDNIYGGSGNFADHILGCDGNDLLSGGRGRDIIEGGSGDDVLRGGSNSDRLLGGEGNDVLQGQKGRDHLDGGAGDDILSGGRGRDQLIGGSGLDSLNGSTSVAYGRDHYDFGDQSPEPEPQAEPVARPTTAQIEMKDKRYDPERDGPKRMARPDEQGTPAAASCD